MLENTAVELLVKKSGGPAQLRQIWKVQHIERNLYSVRSAYRLGMGYNIFIADYPEYPDVGLDGIPIDGWWADLADIILAPGS